MSFPTAQNSVSLGREIQSEATEAAGSCCWVNPVLNRTPEHAALTLRTSVFWSNETEVQVYDTGKNAPLPRRDRLN